MKLNTMKSYPFVAHSENDKKRIAGAKWVIVDAEVEQKNAESDFHAAMEINKYFVPGKSKLSPDKMRTVLASFNDSNIKFDNNTSIDTISTWLYDKAHDTKTVQGSMSNQQRFLMLVNMRDEELETRALIQKAVKAGTFRVKSGKYFYAGNEISHNLESLVKKLQNPENSNLLTAIQEEIYIKAPTNV
ncbi:MAG TPA: hypothetical protein PKD00_01705 [Burkholderiales bacterium]|nr:hypothetical protein [Burkholderiales bacterium]